MTDVGSLVTAGVALVVAAGGYVQFVLRRSIHPCIEMDAELVAVRVEPGAQLVGELVIWIKNVGPGIGFVANVQARVQYRIEGESEVGSDALEPNFGHELTVEPASESSLGRAQKESSLKPAQKREEERRAPTRILKGPAFLVAPRSPRNFIQPGVTQRYRKPLVFPADAELVHVWAAFQYHIGAGRTTWFLARFLTERPTRRIVDYTVRRTFRLSKGRLDRVDDGERVPKKAGRMR